MMNPMLLLTVFYSILSVPFHGTRGTPLTSSSSIDLTNIMDQCLTIEPLITLTSSISLSPLLSCNRDFFHVVLNSTTLTGLNQYTLTPFNRANKDKYAALMKIDSIGIQSRYHINGPVAHMFPVDGQGTMEMNYSSISIQLSLRKVSQKVQFEIERIDFENAGYEVINGGQTVDNKGDHLDKGFQESLGKVIFWQAFKALQEEPEFASSVNCIEESVQSAKLMDNLIQFDDEANDKINEIVPHNESLHHDDRVVDMRTPIHPSSPSSHHASIYSSEGYSRIKRESGSTLPNIPSEEFNESHWYKLASANIEQVLNTKKHDKSAKNVILFIGDGMGISTLTAARILKDQLNGGPGNSNRLFFEGFPQSALIKTFNLDRQTPDSAGTATAFTCGIKANYGTLGVSGRVFRGEKDCKVIESNGVPSIFTWAQAKGKGTGIVTTTRITHATPAAGYAHVANRDWESDTDVGKYGANCRDIAKQLVEDAPGNKLNVIMGGGWKSFAGPNVSDPTASAGQPGVRTDGVNLIDKWVADKTALSANFSFVSTTKDLEGVDLNKTDYLFGLFDRDHLPYELERNTAPEGSPSLAKMVESAIKVLSKHENGFVLLVEGGLIDIAHHDNYARLSLHEVLGLDAAIETARKMLPEEETLMIVTADHSHGFVINGYPLRGNDIFGVSDHKEETSEKTFSTLMYTTGPGHVEPRTDEIAVNGRDQARYRFYSAINMSSAVHGGEDVAVYSSGPMSHLFNGLHDQSYIAHVVAYSSCIGQYSQSERCRSQHNAISGIPIVSPTQLYLTLSVILTVFYQNRLRVL